MRPTRTIIAAMVLCALLAAAPAKNEFVPAKPDPLVGDWQGEGGVVAQVIATGDDAYQASLLKGGDTADKPLAVLKGTRAGDTLQLNGDGWTATLDGSRFTATKDAERFDLKHITRTSPTLGAAAPRGAIVLFDGKSLDAWVKKDGKDWLKEGGPPAWKLVDGAMEVVPGSDSLISRQSFGDCRVHLEFRTLGAPTNSGIYLQARYEVNVSETYGRPEGSPSGGLDNCTEKGLPRVRASLPPLAWQTLDIDFRAPRFDADSKKTAAARATVRVNGVTVYDDQELSPPRGAAGRLGEAPAGPLLLQEHGAPLQFRNIWVVPTKG